MKVILSIFTIAMVFFGPAGWVVVAVILLYLFGGGADEKQ